MKRKKNTVYSENGFYFVFFILAVEGRVTRWENGKRFGGGKGGEQLDARTRARIEVKSIYASVLCAKKDDDYYMVYVMDTLSSS